MVLPYIQQTDIFKWSYMQGTKIDTNYCMRAAAVSKINEDLVLLQAARLGIYGTPQYLTYRNIYIVCRTYSFL